MTIHKQRVQTVLDEEQYDQLQELAQKRETTVADAVKARRVAALRRLYEMGQEAEAAGEVMPDWEELEEQIIQARIAHMEARSVR